MIGASTGALFEGHCDAQQSEPHVAYRALAPPTGPEPAHWSRTAGMASPT